MKKLLTSVMNYFPLKEMLTRKFGEPSDYGEKFYGSEPRNRMHQVRLDNGKYYATYETAKGTIQLSIEHDGVTSYFVQLAFWDKIKSDLLKATSQRRSIIRQMTQRYPEFVTQSRANQSHGR